MELEWLENNGFNKVGKFISKTQNDSGIGVEFEDSKFVNGEQNWIYAFILCDEIKYIGETAQTLAQRIRLYCAKSHKGSTNTQMRERLKKLIEENQTVDIYAQQAPWVNVCNRRLQIRVDLEISMIQEIKPEWNKKGL